MTSRMVVDDDNPGLVVLRDDVPVAADSADAFVPEQLIAGLTYTLRYTLINTGTTELHLLGDPVVSATAGANVAELTVTELPVSPLPAMSRTSMTVTFVATDEGALNFALRLETNTDATPTFEWTVAGTALASRGDGSGCSYASASGTSPLAWLLLFAVILWRRCQRRVS